MTGLGSSRKPRSRARNTGRLVAAVVFYGFLAPFVIITTIAITQQVFFAPGPEAPYASCHEGLRALWSAVLRAREAAPGADGEDAALDRFRAALDPEWTYRDGVAALCRDARSERGALDAIERLRYAEEHAARREAGELAPLRRKVHAIVERDFEGLPLPSPSPDAPR